MSATSNSHGWLALWLGLTCQLAVAQTNATPKTSAAIAAQTYTAARERFHNETTNAEAAWQFGRASFDRAEFATNNTERAVLAVEGIAAMRELVARQPKLAAGHYYLAMNLGQLARTKMLGALMIVDEMEREFKTAHDLDEHFDFAGPDRNLGTLYFEAPGWPTSIGNRSKARKHFERAVELAPEFPENHLNLLAAYVKWEDHNGLRRELGALEKLWPMARTNFTGDAWQSSWADWQTRAADLKPKAAALLKAH
jgi:tetratricopeptide (TPR) repeat protein